jgi:undecaprenyl-diphosphatase
MVLLCGLVTLAGAFLALAKATEDVTQRNGLETTDAANLHWFTSHRTPTLIHLARSVTDIGNPFVLAFISMLAGLLLWRVGQRLFVVVAPGASLVLASSAATIGKIIVNRSRPPIPLHLITETDASFPSGHATEATALFITLALIVAVFVLRRTLTRVAVVAAAVTGSASVSLSRLVLGVHWPSDVIAGAMAGLVIALGITVLAVFVDALGPSDWAVHRSQRVWSFVNLRHRGPALHTT